MNPDLVLFRIESEFKPRWHRNCIPGSIGVRNLKFRNGDQLLQSRHVSFSDLHLNATSSRTGTLLEPPCLHSISHLLPFKISEVCWKSFGFFVLPFWSLVYRGFTGLLFQLVLCKYQKYVYVVHCNLLGHVLWSVMELASPLNDTGMKLLTRMKFHSGMRTGMNASQNELNLIQDSCKQLKEFEQNRYDFHPEWNSIRNQVNGPWVNALPWCFCRSHYMLSGSSALQKISRNPCSPISWSWWEHSAWKSCRELD